MTTYEPGTVARIVQRPKDGSTIKPITYERAIWDALNGSWVSGSHGEVYESDVWNIEAHPLFVLDLDDPNLVGCSAVTPSPDGVVAALMDTNSVAAHAIARQIEAQTKPPRIPEPGLWGVVEAATTEDPHTRRRYGRTAGRTWTRENSATQWEWSELIDPFLVRDGIEDGAS